MKNRRTTRSKSTGSVKNLPAKTVLRKTSDVVKGGFSAVEHGGSASSGAGAGNVKFNEITIRKLTDA